MIDGISIRILGDFGPFSKMGKSIGYEITIGDSVYLFDCGSPMFQQIGGSRLKDIKGIFITHCHDDHKRWFTDLALFHRYAPEVAFNIFLMTSEDIYSELRTASSSALDRSLSNDSKTIIDIPTKEYLNYQVLGPRAKYRIESKDEGNGKTGLYIVGLDGKVIDSHKAKIVISRETGRPRMLFKDPNYKEWVEPESFYPFSSKVFYEEDTNIYNDGEGFTIEAIKAPVWHGIPNIGLKIKTDKETLILSSDTVHDTTLWKQLYSEKRPQQLAMSRKEFESASVIYGDINDYIERTWSEERYGEAITSFDDAVVIHDISIKNSIVHTDYEKLGNTVLNKKSTLLTHGPDIMVSEWALCNTDKNFKIKGNRFFEVVNGTLYPLDADIYIKDAEHFYVGYRNENGEYTIYEKDGLLKVSSKSGANGKALYRIDLYEDVSGRYFPKLEDKDIHYLERKDGQVELIRIYENGSKGTIVENQRDRLSMGFDKTNVKQTTNKIVSKN